MNMTGVNPAGAGGPVGGNMMMMNNGSPAMQQNMESPSEYMKQQLNTYIYEYLFKVGLADVARTLITDHNDKFKIRVKPPKSSPNNRKNGEVNGVDSDVMDMDMKDNIPDDMPRPDIPEPGTANGFLLEWFSIFSDLYIAHAHRGKMQGPAAQFLMHTQNVQRMRDGQQNAGLVRPGMMNPNNFAMRNMRNMANGGMAGGDLRKTMTPQQVQHMKMIQQQQQAQQQQMQQQQMSREQNDVDMNGRSGSPAEGDNGGSPSKRPRLENQQFNGGVMPNGRPMPGIPPQGMMIQNSFNPGQMNQAQFRQNGAMAQKTMQPNIPNGMMNMNNGGSPMMPGINPGQFGDTMAMDMYNSARMAGQPMQGGPGAANSGNHALQDYQMQLMLLEQQNKKRLMMARQEQDNAVNRDGGPMPVGMSSGMSPSGSRSGTSPNPPDQIKRTPQLGGLPGSPAAGDMQGRSPAPMGFMNGMPPGDFNHAMFMGDKQGMVGPGAPGMRPPTSMNMGQPGRMNNQFQGGQPMAQNPSQGGQPMNTPGQRNDMPPPQAPAGGSAQRNQPSSPAHSSVNPPTPSQTNKPNPKSKKAKDDSSTGAANKKRPTKKASTANAPAESEPPATPTPSTPITPQHHQSFNPVGSKGQAPGIPNAPQVAVQQMPNQQPMQQPDMSGANAFQNFDQEQSFNLDFSTLDDRDVLENFDFDSFLNTTTDDAFPFDSGMGPDFSLETGD